MEIVATTVRRIVEQNAQLAGREELRDDTDLYRAGLTSHASINLMLALEEEFGVEFPQRMLKKSTFQSVRSICSALGELLGDGSTSMPPQGSDQPGHEQQDDEQNPPVPVAPRIPGAR